MAWPVSPTTLHVGGERMGLLSPTLGSFQTRGPLVQARRRLVMTFPVVPRKPSRTHPQASSPSALRWGAGEEVRAQRPTTQPPGMKRQEDGESHQRRPSQTTLSSGYWEAEGKGSGPPCWGGGGQSGGAAPPRTPSPGLGPTAAQGQVTGGRRGRVCFPSSILQDPRSSKTKWAGPDRLALAKPVSWQNPGTGWQSPLLAEACTAPGKCAFT